MLMLHWYTFLSDRPKEEGVAEAQGHTYTAQVSGKQWVVSLHKVTKESVYFFSLLYRASKIFTHFYKLVLQML